jgi:(R,R)-butanediol dehydrogenase/meso-butanediol dehydrogenase/diacetyl reductase
MVVTTCGCSSMARAPAFQAGYAGSIPVTRSMRAAILEEMGRPLAVADVADPEPGPGDVVVAVEACGICGSDLHASDNLPLSGLVMGHEFCGSIVATGPGVDQVREGDRVVGLSLVSCGQCQACREGRIRKCLAAQMIGIERPGAYAEFVALPQSAVLALPDHLDHRHGALAEPLAVARHAVHRAQVAPGDTVAVLGAGPVGLAVTSWLADLGAAQVVAIDPVAARRRAASAVGATASIDPTGLGSELADAVAEACGGAPQRVIECVGVPGLLEQSLAIAAVDATVAVTGVCMEPESITPLIPMVKELSVNFAFFYQYQDMVEAIGAMAAGRINVDAMVSDEVPLAELPERFEQLKSPGDDVKVLVRPRQESNLRPPD